MKINETVHEFQKKKWNSKKRHKILKIWKNHDYPCRNFDRQKKLTVEEPEKSKNLGCHSQILDFAVNFLSQIPSFIEMKPKNT